MLFFIFIFLFISLLFILFIDKTSIVTLRAASLFVSSVVFLCSVKLLLNFDLSNFYFQEFVFLPLPGFYNFRALFSFGLDGLSLLFFLLSSFLIFLCVLFILDEKELKFYILNILLIELLLLLVFSSLNLLFFYIFFEAILIPMYLIVGIWGSRERKVWASYLLFFYTLCGSLFFLLGILYIYKVTGTTSIAQLYAFVFSFEEQYFLWLAFFLSFSSKIPVFPLHIWLPEAHVEAPTVGSVLLAGVLLKLGVYGFIRFSLCLFPNASLYFTPLIYTLCAIGVVYTSFSAIRQTDLKRIIAYSSIAHMNLIVIGLFSFNSFGIGGAILQSISHGFVASALFFLIGIVYSRYHTRSVFYYGGLAQLMPVYSSFFLIFTMANIALPGTGGFVGEFLILLGIFQINFKLAFIVTTSVILGGSYSLWVYNRIVFGNIKHIYTPLYSDLSLREFAVIFPLTILTFLMGFLPNFFFKYIYCSTIGLFVQILV